MLALAAFVPQPRKRANPPPKRSARGTPAEEARVVLILALLSSASPFLVLALRPLVSGPPYPPPALWEGILLAVVTPVLALMSLALFARSSGARALPAGRGGAALAAASLLLGLASLVQLLRGKFG